MALTVSRKTVHKVTVQMDGGDFVAVIRTMKGRQQARATPLFVRLARKLEALEKLIPAGPPAEEGGKPQRVSLVDLTPEMQDAVLELSADLTDDLVDACAYGLHAVEGIEEDGKPLIVPASFGERQEFIDTWFDFSAKQQIAVATINHNAVTEKDAGN